MDPYRRTHKRTTPTNDQQALAINATLNQVASRIAAGNMLLDALNRRFGGDTGKFRAWLKNNVDISTATAVRAMQLAQHGAMLDAEGYTSLQDVYRLLGLDERVTLSELQQLAVIIDPAA